MEVFLVWLGLVLLVSVAVTVTQVLYLGAAWVLSSKLGSKKPGGVRQVVRLQVCPRCRDVHVAGRGEPIGKWVGRVDVQRLSK